MHNHNNAWLRIFLGVLALSASCSSALPSGSGSMHHIVLCWLRDAGDEQAQSELIRVSKGFIAIPGVVSVSAGRSVPSDRPIVDSSFDVAVVVVLENRSALQAFLEHPLHKAARRETLEPLAERIVVYDFDEH